ncbi:hypothetical protein OAK75_07195 [Bacteriovoracales bacterium]|nr:hypothetical protein [Bacteriovoracales bacterium]
MKNKSVSKQLFKIIFGIYFSVTIILTVIQMISTFISARDDVKEELAGQKNAVESGLANALYIINNKQTAKILKEMMSISSIQGIELTNNENKKITIGKVIELQKENNPIVYNSPMLRNSKVVGHIKIYSSSDFVLSRVIVGFSLLITIAILKTILLFFLFFYTFKNLLNIPLFNLTKLAKEVNFKDLKIIDAKLNKKEKNELNSLEESINSMIEHLYVSKEELLENEKLLNYTLKKNEVKAKELESLNKEVHNLNSNLEDKVKQKVEELNISLETTRIMFSNINKAVFCVDKLGIIITPISPFSEVVFGKSIVGENFLKLLFFHFKEGSKEKEDLKSIWPFLFGGDEMNYFASEEHLPNKVIQPDEMNPFGKALEINYAPIYKEKAVDKLMIIVDDVTRIEQEYTSNKESTVELIIMKEILNYKNKKLLFIQSCTAITKLFSILGELILFKSKNNDLNKLKSILEVIFTISKSGELKKLDNLQQLIYILKEETRYKENIKDSKAQIWAIEKGVSILDYFIKYYNIFNYLSDKSIILESDNIFKIILASIEDKRKNLNIVMSNLLEYVFLVRNTDSLNDKNIANAPKKAKLYGEFDNSIFRIKVHAKLISYLLNFSKKEESSKTYSQFSDLLEHMPSKDKLTRASLENHLIIPFKKIEELED